MTGNYLAMFRREERAQDLIEYTLLLGLVALGIVGLFSSFGDSLQDIWSSGGSTVTATSSSPSDTTPAQLCRPGAAGQGDQRADHGPDQAGGR